MSQGSDPAAGPGGTTTARRLPVLDSRWLAGRTLRGRLIAGLLLLLALACAVVGIVSYLALHRFLLGQLDSQVTVASQRYRGCLNGPPPGDDNGDSAEGGSQQPGNPENCGEQQAPQTFSAVLRNGVLYGEAVAYGDCNLNAADRAVLTSIPVNGSPTTHSLSSLGAYRLVAVSGGGNRAYISGLPLSPVSSTLRQVELTEAAVFAAALLLTGVIGTGWVRLSLRPLRRVAATATRVTQLPLGSGDVVMPERVPDADPRTEIGQVGMAFNRMLGHVERALARRAASEARLRRFAADASHELRTPLAAIRGYAELARRNPGPVPEDVAHALSRVESEASRMSVLVDELLLLAQLDAGRPLASEPVDLTRLTIDAASDARVAAPYHRWVLELPDEPVSVRGDEHRLRQVLANLAGNAARHTPRGTTVTMTLLAAAGDAGKQGQPQPGQPDRAQPGQPGSVQLSVTDDGPGIPADLQPALFERFVRGDSARSPSGGSTGLGLAIVDAVVAAHGGQVAVTSGPGRTSFVITLPALAIASSSSAGE
ncbi:MAG: HAMP domain-containing sensor histidine kinase [Streptosporangiaceae bacterium]|jgi:two-component system OmpR family sensor kinase